MQLVLFVDGRVLDTISLSYRQSNNENYIQLLQRLLYIKNKLTITLLRKVPKFYLEAESHFTQEADINT